MQINKEKFMINLFNQECSKNEKILFLEALISAISILYQDGQYTMINDIGFNCEYNYRDKLFRYSFMITNDIVYMNYLDKNVIQLFHLKKTDLSFRKKIQVYLDEVHKFNNLKYLHKIYHDLTQLYPHLDIEFGFESENLYDIKYIDINKFNLTFIIYPHNKFKIIMEKDNTQTILIDKICNCHTMYELLTNQINIHCIDNVKEDS